MRRDGMKRKNPTEQMDQKAALAVTSSDPAPIAAQLTSPLPVSSPAPRLVTPSRYRLTSWKGNDEHGQKEASPDLDRLLTIKQTAQILNCSEKSVRRKIADGKIEAMKDGNMVPCPSREAFRATSTTIFVG